MLQTTDWFILCQQYSAVLCSWTGCCAGEANIAYNRDVYNCTFPAMINDWRQQWYIGTDAHTQLFFPFGFIQVYAVCCCSTVHSYFSSVSGQPHNNWWWCRNIDYPLLDAEHSLCTAPWSGTPCRTTSAHSRTMSPLDRVWKRGFSLDTSVFSALETSW